LLGAELSQGFNHRVIGFLASKAFHALAARDTRLDVAAPLAAEEIDQRSLSHAGLAGDERALPSAVIGVPQQFVQPLELLLASENTAGGRRGLRSIRAGCVLFAVFHLGDEP